MARPTSLIFMVLCGPGGLLHGPRGDFRLNPGDDGVTMGQEGLHPGLEGQPMRIGRALGGVAVAEGRTRSLRCFAGREPGFAGFAAGLGRQSARKIIVIGIGMGGEGGICEHDRHRKRDQRHTRPPPRTPRPRLQQNHRRL